MTISSITAIILPRLLMDTRSPELASGPVNSRTRRHVEKENNSYAPNNNNFIKSRHTRESGYPVCEHSLKDWIPVFTGMTKNAFSGFFANVSTISKQHIQSSNRLMFDLW
jgi:N-acetylneuraminic acid mutarotase